MPATSARLNLIGQLLYCQQQTVPEISWSVSILARFTTKAGAPHMALAKKVLRYLQGRKSIPLRWCGRSCQKPHPDANFADVKAERLSSMGYIIMMMMSFICSCRKKIGAELHIPLGRCVPSEAV
jgi:hypothetical protein